MLTAAQITTMRGLADPAKITALDAVGILTDLNTGKFPGPLDTALIKGELAASGVWGKIVVAARGTDTVSIACNNAVAALEMNFVHFENAAYASAWNTAAASLVTAGVIAQSDVDNINGMAATLYSDAMQQLGRPITANEVTQLLYNDDGSVR
jgi:hypothetical protein